MRILLPTALLACRAEPQPAQIEALEVSAPLPGVYLARQLRVDLSAPAALRLTLSGPQGSPRVWTVPEATEHRLPLLTLHAETTYQLEVQIEGGGEGAVRTFTTQPLPEPFPIVEVLANEVDTLEPGHTLLPINHYNGTASYAVVFDEDWRPVYLFEAGRHWTDVRLLDDGTLMSAAKPVVEQVGLLGEGRITWGDGPGEIQVGVGTLHHDAIPYAGGVLTLAHVPLQVDAYPTSYADPHELQPATLRDDVVLHLGLDGTVLRARALSELLDTSRIGWNSLSMEPEGLDWAHANAVSPLPDGGLLISCRNQDVLLGLDADWQLSWLLGRPEGFGPQWQELFLQPTLPSGAPDPGWIANQHQHGPELHDDGRLYVFDNGDRGHTPYDPGSGTHPLESRLLALQLDPDSGTFSQLWSWRHPDTRLWSGAMGDADWQPQTGNVLGVWGFVGEEDGIRNRDLGYGDRSVRVMEIDPDRADPLLDVRLRSDASGTADNDGGYFVYRAQRIAPLHTQPHLIQGR